VGDLTPSLQTFAETFIQRAIPVSYQIIPARLTPSCADYLVSLHSAHPGLIEFGQHGLHHRMSVGGRELKREFGPERDFESQKATIAEGYARLREMLGEAGPVRVFTPPQHKFNRDTVRAAANVGHDVFSAAAYLTRHHRAAYAVGRRLGLSSFAHHGVSYHPGLRPEADIVEMSIAIDVDDGRRIKRTAAGLRSRLREFARGDSRIGLMFHHELYAGEASRKELVEIVSALADAGVEHFHLLGSLARPGEV